ncbi:hypothetical protein [Occultella gossypii]|uniref:hypothetical protein n=1 Tax=Occultella gossypii TaxID=2800820 RepID=UPI0020170D36|nr:hypothetical protein [Occultella gossypii]
MNIDRTMDGYHVAGFLTIEHGQYIRTALEAIMGKPAAGETRTSGQRRAQALSDLAHMMLDQGKVGTSASVRPHLGVLISYPEFLDAIKTTETAAGDNAAEAAPGNSASDPAPVATLEPVTELLPGLDTTNDPAERSPRSSGAPTTADQEADPANSTGACAEAPVPSSPITPRDLANERGAATEARTPSSAAAPGTGAREPDPSAQAPISSSAPTGATTGAAPNTSASAQAPTPSSTPDRAGLPGCQSRAVGPLGQSTTGTALPGANGTALPGATGTAGPGATGTAGPGATGTAGPGANGTALPSGTGTALPGAHGTAVPGVNGTALPSTGRDWAALLAAGPATFIDNTGPVPRDLLDRIIGCAGEIYRIIFGPDNEILNHGRAHRLFTAAQRRAHVARDRHCVHPDCTVPPER